MGCKIVKRTRSKHKTEGKKKLPTQSLAENGTEKVRKLFPTRVLFFSKKPHLESKRSSYNLLHLDFNETNPDHIIIQTTSWIWFFSLSSIDFLEINYFKTFVVIRSRYLQVLFLMFSLI
jgi:hypothetical protein